MTKDFKSSDQQKNTRVKTKPKKIQTSSKTKPKITLRAVSFRNRKKTKSYNFPKNFVQIPEKNKRILKRPLKQELLLVETPPTSIKKSLTSSPFLKNLEEKRQKKRLAKERAVKSRKERKKRQIKRLKNKGLRYISKKDWNGIVYVQSTNNNSIMTLTDKAGNCKTAASAGLCDFKGSRRSTIFAAQETAKKVAKKALVLGYQVVCVKLKGAVSFSSKKKILKSLSRHGLIIGRLEHINSIAHNGCRLPKKRRV